MFARQGVEMEPELARAFIFEFQKYYKKLKHNKVLYSNHNYIPENIISMYMYYIHHLNYQAMIEDYKQKFIWNEAIVEPGVTKEEKRGLGLIYDYISAYNFEKKGYPDMFIEALKLHSLLYSQCPYPEFGGRLRVKDVYLKDTPYDVPSADVARTIFNTYIGKKVQLKEDGDIFIYIDECVRANIDLIKLQPFADGNKRTLRSLLNLQLACIGIPPVYIKKSEREIYRQKLRDAILTGNYSNITRFYYYKICDAIVEMDLNNIKTEEKGKSFIIEPKKKTTH